MENAKSVNLGDIYLIKCELSRDKKYLPQSATGM